jgi:pimeloyl-ACP methyl ester carboxylesterase
MTAASAGGQMMRGRTLGRWLLPCALCALTAGSCAAPGEPSTMEAAMAATEAAVSDVAPAATRADELRMQTQVSGTGPRLVLVGGGLTGWASWAPHAERLTGTRTVARLQLLSVQFGLADRLLPVGYSVGLESRAMAAALDALGWTGPLDIVAWSYGALITLQFALDRPERVRTLTLIEPPALWVLPDRGRGDPDVERLHELAGALASGAPGGDSDRASGALTAGASGDVSAADLEVFLRAAALVPPGTDPRALPQWPLWLEHRRSLRTGLAPLQHSDDLARLRSFDRPVLLVTGTGTAPFLRRIQDKLVRTLPAARAVEMPAGHAPQLVSPDRFLAELAAFHAEGQ